MALILLTNDDGISAAGLCRLEEALEGLGDLFVVAPDRERSAVSHGLTIQVPLELGRIDARHFTLNGTPADCIIYSITRLLPSPPDLVVSGINHGANLGDDIMYSGTVAAAREASRRGIAAVAASQAFDEKAIAFGEGAKFIRTLVRTMLQNRSGTGAPLNVNFPIGPVRGVKITRQGTSSYFTHVSVLDEHVRTGRESSAEESEKAKVELLSDYQAIVGGYISITPLQRDQTDYEAARVLQNEFPRILRGKGLPRLGLIKYGN